MYHFHRRNVVVFEVCRLVIGKSQLYQYVELLKVYVAKWSICLSILSASRRTQHRYNTMFTLTTEICSFPPASNIKWQSTDRYAAGRHWKHNNNDSKHQTLLSKNIIFFLFDLEYWMYVWTSAWWKPIWYNPISWCNACSNPCEVNRWRLFSALYKISFRFTLCVIFIVGSIHISI